MNSLNTKEHTYALVSTVRFLLLVNLNTKAIIPLEFNRPEYYGISWFPNEKELILSHSMLDNNALTDISHYATSEVGIISRGEFASPEFLSQPHQIFCASDGRIICTNTGRNAISIIDLAKPNYIQEARISLGKWDRLSKDNKIGDHLNSVFEKNGLLYVIAHRFDKGSLLATLSYPGLELQTLEEVKGHTGLHNIWVTNEDQHISCATEQGGLIEINEKTTTLWESKSAFTRGLAASSEFILVGESQYSARTSRPFSDSGLWMLDRKTYQPLDYFYLGPFGGVHEVRLVNKPDEAHHNAIFSGFSDLLKNHPMLTFSREKVEKSKLLTETRQYWSSFSPLIDSSKINFDHSQTAEDELCIILQSKTIAESKSMQFRYALHGNENSHVSAIIYNGFGSDTHMYAFLLQSDNNTEAHLSLWENDGENWKTHSKITSNLAISGNVKIIIEATDLKCYIDNSLVATIPNEDLAIQPESKLGIRWLGATIYPITSNSLEERHELPDKIYHT